MNQAIPEAVGDRRQVLADDRDLLFEAASLVEQYEDAKQRIADTGKAAVREARRSSDSLARAANAERKWAIERDRANGLQEQLEAYQAALLRIEQLAWDELKGEIRSATIHSTARGVLYPASSPKAGDLLWMTVPDGEQPPVGWTRNRPSDNRAWRIADGTEPAPARGRLPGPHPHDGYIQTVQVEPPRYFAVCCGCGSDMFPDRDTPEEAQADHHEHVEAVLRGSFQESRPEL